MVRLITYWDGMIHINKTMSSPDIFGPKLWFLLHNSASLYPEKPTNAIKQEMKNMIIGIPSLVLCNKCKAHIRTWIYNNSDLDRVVKNRDSLFLYFLQMHNDVNRRIGKPIWTLEKAISKYLE